MRKRSRALFIVLQLHSEVIQNRYHKPITQDGNAHRDRHTQIKVNTLFKQYGYSDKER